MAQSSSRLARALTFGALFATAAFSAQAQSATTRAPGPAQQRALARYTPANSANCGYDNAPLSWGYGTVFADTLGLHLKSWRQIASAWCIYLTTGDFPEPYSNFARWSDAQLADQLSLDPGIEWARQKFDSSRIRFQIFQLDTTVKERFEIKTVIEAPDPASWPTQAVHTVTAMVYRDTVRFESALVPRLASSMRWISSPLEFVRLDSGGVDTVRALAASKFVLDTRRRLGIQSSASENVLYLYTKAGNGRDLLGFSYFNAAIDGFATASPRPFLFANVSAAGEFYRHELVHVALMPLKTYVDASLAESLAKVLGGTLQRTWPQFVCEERSLILKPVKAGTLTDFFATPEDELDENALRPWENAFYIDYLQVKSGDAALKALLDGAPKMDTREQARTTIAGLMKLPVADFMKGFSEYYSEKAVAQRCSRK